MSAASQRLTLLRTNDLIEPHLALVCERWRRAFAGLGRLTTLRAARDHRGIDDEHVTRATDAPS